MNSIPLRHIIAIITIIAPMASGSIYAFVDIKQELAVHQTALTDIKDNLGRLDSEVAQLLVQRQEAAELGRTGW